jgi:hypothetical protein
MQGFILSVNRRKRLTVRYERRADLHQAHLSPAVRLAVRATRQPTRASSKK